MRAPTAEGTFVPTLYPRPNRDQAFIASLHTTIFGDRFDILAYQSYGDPELWWVLARVNPDVFYPDDIPPGTVIHIPRLDDILPDVSNYGDYFE